MKRLYAKAHQWFWSGLHDRLGAAMDRAKPSQRRWHVLNDLDWLLHELAYWTSPDRKALTPTTTR
jgi:hypothetical protein